MKRKPAIIAIVLVCFLVLALGFNTVIQHNRTLRGARSAGVDIGAMSTKAATATLEKMLKTRTVAPLTLRSERGTIATTPAELGLTFDAAATAEVAKETRGFSSYFRGLFGGTTDIIPQSHIDEKKYTAAITRYSRQLERHQIDGHITYKNGKPIAHLPVSGVVIDQEETKTYLLNHWLTEKTVTVKMKETTPSVSAETVNKTVETLATEAVSAPLVISGKADSSMTISPASVGTLLSFQPNGKGGLTPQINIRRAQRLITAGLGSTEKKPNDPTVELRGGEPTIVPGVDGETIDTAATLNAFTHALTTAGKTPRHRIAAIYRKKIATGTIADARKLKIKSVIAEFTTGGFEFASGVNIGIVAQTVNGAIVKPGETFSLNGFTGPRGSAQGYVESGIINNGRPARAVGGGISQFATTLYNAAYFAGFDDVDHTEHSYYISRYPEAREATVFDGAIDLQFRNNSPYGALIESYVSGNEVTVRIWSTPYVTVESTTGIRTAPTNPNTVTLPAGDDCVPSTGSPGFTSSNTRTITNIATGATQQNTRTVKYDPHPTVKCVK